MSTDETREDEEKREPTRGFVVRLPKSLADMTDEEIDAFVDETAPAIYEHLTRRNP